MNSRLLLVCTLVACLCVSGCSTRFVYNNIDWFLHWHLDDYIELDREQKAILNGHLEKWQRWHRQQELIAYRQQLLALKTTLQQGPLSQQQWLRELDTAQRHWQRLRDEISPELATLALHLRDDQVADLFRKLAEDNDKAVRERDKKTPEERWQGYEKSIRKQIKQFIGRLSPRQTNIVSDRVHALQSTFDEWISYRRALQASARKILLARHNDPDFTHKLERLLLDPDAFKSATYLAAQSHNRQVFADLLASLNSTLSDKQLRHALTEIDDWLDDINRLIEG
ncbi:MAG: hypothetical protein GYB33_00955 [Gammaproteobacteria bacterium]|uniref:DUF6279 family lipoprotein n=1 Tax=Pseudomaricurvus alcaniphilus TaxID=1166482 RepID=UPI00140DE85A|nr:DUF6279 family lipoprotein [Pseudomaricurvus alcaniphilus]MBR9908900.1 hypothetical protein [Gammaproteobacteria bacterium]NHN37953.1 hypothetical protein [Pseudomaricurvus alcaniphilus]